MESLLWPPKNALPVKPLPGNVRMTLFVSLVNTNITEKCNLYHHRVDQGFVPACADNTYLAHFIYFGEADVVR